MKGNHHDRGGQRVHVVGVVTLQRNGTVSDLWEPIQARNSRLRPLAVDAPDGESDAIHEQDLQAVEQVIDYAADHEDKEKVLQMQKLENAVREKIMFERF